MLNPTSLSKRKVCEVCSAPYMPLNGRQRVCGAVRCRRALHNQAEKLHWERAGSARQERWYWVEGGKEAKAQARLAKVQRDKKRQVRRAVDKERRRQVRLKQAVQVAS